MDIEKKVEHKNFLHMQKFQKCVVNFSIWKLLSQKIHYAFSTQIMDSEKSKRWSKENNIKLIKLKNSPDWDDKFILLKNKAKQLGKLWQELSKEFGSDFTGLELKNQYNNLLNQFKKHHIIASRSGEGAVNWPYYNALKESLIKNPKVSPICVLDNGNLSNADNNDDSTECSIIYSENTVFSASERSQNKIKKYNFNEKIAESMEARNRILESLVNSKNESVVEVQNEVKLLTSNFLKTDEKVIAVQNDVKSLAQEVKETNSKIDSMLDMISKFMNNNK